MKLGLPVLKIGHNLVPKQRHRQRHCVSQTVHILCIKELMVQHRCTCRMISPKSSVFGRALLRALSLTSFLF